MQRGKQNSNENICIISVLQWSTYLHCYYYAALTLQFCSQCKLIRGKYYKFRRRK
jgi:hypothetical protein